MDVIFCHGLESAPHGRKFLALEAAGLAPHAPDFQGMSLAQRVDTLIPVLRARPGAVVVGSSYGGITALCAAIEVTESGGQVAALVLCAPALARAEPPATAMQLYPPVPTTIIHGVRDEVVPIEVSRRFAADHPEVELIEVDDEHRLASSLDLIVAATQRAIGSAGR